MDDHAISFANPKAADAASTPMTVTRNAPLSKGWPVSLLFTNPNPIKQITVIAQEYFNPSKEELVKK